LLPFLKKFQTEARTFVPGFCLQTKRTRWCAGGCAVKKVPEQAQRCIHCDEHYNISGEWKGKGNPEIHLFPLFISAPAGFVSCYSLMVYLYFP
jgi:hypothetical protein